MNRRDKNHVLENFPAIKGFSPTEKKERKIQRQDRSVKTKQNNPTVWKFSKKSKGKEPSLLSSL